MWKNISDTSLFLAHFDMLYKTNRFHVALRLFSNRSQMTSKCRKDKKVAHEPQGNVSLMCVTVGSYHNLTSSVTYH